jgi:hypothetical protein
MSDKADDNPLDFRNAPNVLRHYRGRDLYGPDGLLGVSRSKFYLLIRAGKLPRPIKLDSVSLWREADLLAAITAWGSEPA